MNVRRIAYRVLRKLEKDNRFPTEEVREALPRMSNKERAFFKELVWGVMRRQVYLDWLLNTYLRNPEIPPGIRTVLRIGAYQLLFMESVPEYAAVSESLKLVENRNFRKLVNAILRKVARDGFKEPEMVHLKYSHPKWIYEELREWGEDVAERIMKDHLMPLPTTLRVNVLKTNRGELGEKIERNGVKVWKTSHSPVALVVKYNDDLTDFFPIRDGLATVQGESSQMVTFLMNPRRFSTVLDLAAGYGGKTTHIAEYMGDSGQIIAVDPSLNKIERLLFHKERLGLKSIETAVMDGREASKVIKEKFDYVLLDAPCTSLGTARKNPDVLLTSRPSDPKKLQRLQLELIESAIAFLKNDGYLVYSTCTFTKAENTFVVSEVLRKHPEMEVVDIRSKLREFSIEYAWDGYGTLFLPDGNVLTEFYVSIIKKR
jgi:16S rRNA (cytosine967-C5)-methyltransferase